MDVLSGSCVSDKRLTHHRPLTLLQMIRKISVLDPSLFIVGSLRSLPPKIQSCKEDDMPRVAKTIQRLRVLPGLILLLCLASRVGSAPQRPAMVQEPKQTVIEGELTLAQVHELPGTELSQATSDHPSGKLQLRGYVLEAVQLPKPVTTEIDGIMSATRRAWRLTVKGGPFPVRSMPAIVWLDDTVAGLGVESPDLMSISVMIFNRNALREGAAIAVSYGVADDSRSELAEKLSIGSLGREGNKQ